MAETQFTSEDIFLQYCQAKPIKATEFINDYILYCLDISNAFESDTYANVRQYIFDFMVGCDKYLNFFMFYLSQGQERFTKENFTDLIEKEFQLSNPQLDEFFYGIVLSNLDKLLMLKNKRASEFDSNEMKNYRVNIQMDFGHSSISNIDNEFKLLLKFTKQNDSKDIFEVKEEEIDPLISKLKDIYCQIKS